MGDPIPPTRTLTNALVAFASTDPTHPSHTVISRAGSTVLDRREFGALAARFGAGLSRAGVKRGDRVVIAHPTSPEFLGAFWGCQAIGAVAIPVAPVMADRPGSAEAQRLRVVLERSRPTAVLAADEVTQTVRAIYPDAPWPVAEPAGAATLEDVVDAVAGGAVDPDTPAIIQFTSGSTSEPRGCVLSHRAITANLAAVQDRLDIFHPMVGVNWCPLFHDMGLIGGVVLPVWTGYLDLVYQPTVEFVFNPLSWLRLMSEHRAEISSAPNFAFELVVRRLERRSPEIDLSCVRSIFNGAEPLDAGVARRFIELLVPYGLSPDAMHPAYGLAEHVVIVASARGGVRTTTIPRNPTAGSTTRPTDVEPADMPVVSLGRPVQGVELRIVDASSTAVEPGTVGEVEVRSDSVMDGYFEDPDATCATLRDGWLRTGDLGFIGADGDLYLVGRHKDLIIIAGRNFYAYDIERAATTVPQVRSNGAAAFGINTGGTEAAVVVAESRASDTEEVCRAIRAACQEAVGVALRDVVIVKPGAVPRTSSGKVQRQAAKAAYMDGHLIVPRLS